MSPRRRIATGADLLDQVGPVTIVELATVLRCSEGYIRKLIKCGVLEVRSLGAHKRIPHREAVRMAKESGALE